MIETATYTDAGPRRENQDRTIDLVRGEYRILGVADGLGGHFGGGLAAQIIVDTLSDCKLESRVDLAEAIKSAHHKILKEQLEDEHLRDMGSTATVAMLSDRHLSGVHVGDTRCVLQRRNGIVRLTDEHTEAKRLLASGRLTKEEYASYPRKNVLDNALGSKRGFWLDTFEHDIMPEDKILITSDGVHDKIKLREILPFLNDYANPQAIIQRLVDELATRNPDDNFSLAVAIVR